jgi:arylsulfatase A-like enzyme
MATALRAVLLAACCPRGGLAVYSSAAAPSSSISGDGAGGAASSGGGSRRPDILFHVIDDLGWNDLGFRNPEIESPELDALAASGVVLADYHVFFWCSPTRSSFLTGRIPFHNGFATETGQPRYGQGFSGGNTEYGISVNFTFLPEVLRSAGSYQTMALGKWYAAKVLVYPSTR